MLKDWIAHPLSSRTQPQGAPMENRVETVPYLSPHLLTPPCTGSVCEKEGLLSEPFPLPLANWSHNVLYRILITAQQVGKTAQSSSLAVCDVCTLYNQHVKSVHTLMLCFRTQTITRNWLLGEYREACGACESQEASPVQWTHDGGKITPTLTWENSREQER